jgi:hypothetical protein
MAVTGGRARCHNASRSRAKFAHRFVEHLGLAGGVDLARQCRRSEREEPLLSFREALISQSYA